MPRPPRALRKAVRDLLGVHTPVQRCIRHKERNILDHLPERDRASVKQRLRSAWRLDEHAVALERLRALAAELDRSHPGAAAALREGLGETLTLQRLGIRGSLKQTLASTNPCESMIECARRTSRNVKRWQSGDRTRPRSHDRPVPDRGARYPRHRLTVTPGPPSRTPTTSGTSSVFVRLATGCVVGSRRRREGVWTSAIEAPAVSEHPFS